VAKKSEAHREANKASSSNQRRARNPGREKGTEKLSYREKIREKKIAANKSKSGCFPKLFMLLLPFIAVGAYLLLRS
jgi:hypothetical protein